MNEIAGYALLFVGLTWALGMIDALAGQGGLERFFGGLQAVAALFLLWNMDSWLVGAGS